VLHTLIVVNAHTSKTIRACCPAAAFFCAGSAGLGELLADLQEPAEAAEYRIGIKVNMAHCDTLSLDLLVAVYTL
jgi:hypothetical protein